MCAIWCRRSGALAVALSVAFWAGAADAKTKPRAKRSATTIERSTELIPIPKFSNPGTANGASTQAVPQMRFFTINGALAKFEGRSSGSDNVRVAAIDPAGKANDAPPAVTVGPARGDGPFGMFSFRAPEGTLWSKWRKVLAAFRTEDQRIVDCIVDVLSCDRASRTMVSMVLRASELNGKERFAMVTRSVNAAVRYANDYAAQGAIDVWSSPLATIEAGIGDCEDYAILKYKVLREAGTPASDLRIVLLKDTASRQDHAVLAARHNEHWFILDNRGSGFYTDVALPHYRPLFGLDANGVQAFAVPYASRQTILAEEPLPALPALDDPLSAPGDIEPVL
jgi:predicted transglutaminase-like cysteine proteinase